MILYSGLIQSFPTVDSSSCRRNLLFLVTVLICVLTKLLDWFILLAKYHILHSKANNSSLLIQIFVRTVKQRFSVEKYNAVINCNAVSFDKEWALYIHFLT